MHTFFANFDKADKFIMLPPEEYKHFRVLRIKPEETFGITNGKGLFAFCKNHDINNIEINVIEIKENYNENNIKINLFCALIQDKSRLEMIVEKATELGVSNINFFHSKNSQKIKINEERLNKKTISALKQSNRSCLPEINISNDIEQLLQDRNGIYYLANQNCENYTISNREETVNLLVGPEGGFSNEEIEYFNNNLKIKNINLGKAILRTETACFSIISRANVG